MADGLRPRRLSESHSANLRAYHGNVSQDMRAAGKLAAN